MQLISKGRTNIGYLAIVVLAAAAAGAVIYYMPARVAQEMDGAYKLVPSGENPVSRDSVNSPTSSQEGQN